jgi:hypothetical protein
MQNNNKQFPVFGTGTELINLLPSNIHWTMKPAVQELRTLIGKRRHGSRAYFRLRSM